MSQEEQRMSIHAFGAIYDGVDVSTTFLKLGVACSGWRPSSPPTALASPADGQAPYIEAALRGIKTGDIAIIKSQSPGNGLRIKGVGIVTDARPHEITTQAGYAIGQLHPGWASLGVGVKVRWTWPDVPDGSFWKMGNVSDGGGNMRTGTVYEEFGPSVAERVIALLLDPAVRQ
jgi:hypothetical protein